MACGEFWDGGEARMGGFAAEFRGFWVARGHSAAIQRTADAGGHSRRKNFLKIFKKGVKTRKLGCGRDRETPYIGGAVRLLDQEARPLAALPEVRFVQVSHLQAPT